MAAVAGNDSYKPKEDDQPVLLKQAKLNGLTQDLNLSKESAQLLSSHLQEKHLLAPGTTFYRCRDRKRIKTLVTFQDKSSLVYCNNITGLTKSMILEYDAMELRHFIDSSS